MEKLKIAIVGAGITGLYLAWKLAKRGNSVTVFEKRNEIGKTVCSGLFSYRIFQFLPQAEVLVENKIKSVVIHFPKRTLKIRFSKEFFLMSHYKLDNLVLGLAKEAGADIVLGKSVDSLPSGFDRVIGCDGANSVIRKGLGLRDPDLRFSILGFVAKEDYSDFVETWAIRGGFIWKIPRGKEIEYGIIAPIETAKSLLDEFLIKRNIKLERVGAALVPQGCLIPSNKEVTLCGDAAGLTKPWSGGGVVWGLMASNLLLQNFPDFIEYKNSLKRFFLPRILFSKLATKMVYFLGFHFPYLLPKTYKIEGDFLL